MSAVISGNDLMLVVVGEGAEPHKKGGCRPVIHLKADRHEDPKKALAQFSYDLGCLSKEEKASPVDYRQLVLSSNLQKPSYLSGFKKSHSTHNSTLFKYERTKTVEATWYKAVSVAVRATIFNLVHKEHVEQRQAIGHDSSKDVIKAAIRESRSLAKLIISKKAALRSAMNDFKKEAVPVARDDWLNSTRASDTGQEDIYIEVNKSN